MSMLMGKGRVGCMLMGKFISYEVHGSYEQADGPT